MSPLNIECNLHSTELNRENAFMCYELGNQKSQVGSNSILKLTLVCGSKFDIQIFKKNLVPKEKGQTFLGPNIFRPNKIVRQNELLV